MHEIAWNFERSSLSLSLSLSNVYESASSICKILIEGCISHHAYEFALIGARWRVDLSNDQPQVNAGFGKKDWHKFLVTRIDARSASFALPNIHQNPLHSGCAMRASYISVPNLKAAASAYKSVEHYGPCRDRRWTLWWKLAVLSISRRQIIRLPLRAKIKTLHESAA